MRSVGDWDQQIVPATATKVLGESRVGENHPEEHERVESYQCQQAFDARHGACPDPTNAPWFDALILSRVRVGGRRIDSTGRERCKMQAATARANYS